MKVIEDLKNYTEEELRVLQEQGTYFCIPDWRVPHLYDSLSSYVKKAEKFNIPYTIEEVGKITRVRGGEEYPCIIVKIEFEIKLGEWEFVASIDHTPNGNIIRKASKRELPEKYRTVKGICEHCKADRNRKNTFVVYSETEGYKQIGKSCLKLYTGIDLSKVGFTYSFIDAIEEYGNDCGEYDYDYCGGRSVSTIDAIDVLALGWKLVNIFGYVKSGLKDSTISRLWEAYEYLDGSMKRYRERRYREYTKFLEDNSIKFFLDEDYDMADKIIKYIMKQKVTSDYMNNLHVIFSNFEEGDNIISDRTIHYKHCYMNKKYTSIVLSAVQTYIRGMNLLQEKQAQHDKDLESKYVGNVGDRISFTAKQFICLQSWDNSFNGWDTTTTYLYKIIDTNNNVYTWRTSKCVNSPFTVTGTVEAHEEYKGIKQTKLTRCKVS